MSEELFWVEGEARAREWKALKWDASRTMSEAQQGCRVAGGENAARPEGPDHERSRVPRKGKQESPKGYT